MPAMLRLTVILYSGELHLSLGTEANDQSKSYFDLINF